MSSNNSYIKLSLPIYSSLANVYNKILIKNLYKHGLAHFIKTIFYEELMFKGDILEHHEPKLYTKQWELLKRKDIYAKKSISLLLSILPKTISDFYYVAILIKMPLETNISEMISKLQILPIWYHGIWSQLFVNFLYL